MSASEGSATRPRHAWILFPSDDAEAGIVRVWSLTSSERLERALRRAGVDSITKLTADAPLPTPAHEAHALFRSNFFYDERLIAGLLDNRDVLLCDDSGDAIAAHVGADAVSETAEALRSASDSRSNSAIATRLRRVTPLEVAPAYNAALRKFDPPFVYRADAQQAREIENRIFASSYKGITDFVTKWVFPVPARATVRLLAARGVTPNTVTAISYVLTALTALLFYWGWFGTGLACAWLMTFLDTVDGKLARVTLTSSPIGNVLDHGLDLLHPPIWWAAWAYGLAPGAAGYELAMWIVVIGYVTGRLLEGVFLLFFGMEIFTWRPFDAFFRTIIARRNPNLLMLCAGVAVGRPGAGFIAVAVWTVACHIVPIVRIAQAFARKRSGQTIRPWHEEEAELAARRASAGSLALLLLVALASASQAAGPPPVLDPSARLPNGDSASEYWDLTAALDSGHRLFARFMITNIGPGDRSAIAVGHVVSPDGSVQAFRNGRRAGKWELSDDRLALDIGSSELDLHGPVYRLDIHKDDVAIDLRFEPAGAAQPPELPAGYSMDILDTAAPASGTLRLPGMATPLSVQGRVGFVHTWMSAAEAELVTRRIEFFSLHPERLYVMEIAKPNGSAIRWFTAAGLPAESGPLSIVHEGQLQHGSDEYLAPGVLVLSSERLKGKVQVGRSVLSYDFLTEIPQPFRFFVALEMQPWRVWAESVFDVTLRATLELSPTTFVGSGVTVVTFSTPTAQP